MTDPMNTWRKSLQQFMASARGSKAAAIPLLMLEYRPDICRAIAWELGAEFMDFRSEVMQAHGMLAHEIGLDELDNELAKRASTTDIVAFNVESLLAAKDESARRNWIRRFCKETFAHSVILPLAIYQDDVSDLEACLDLRDHLFEPQSLISRLAM